jgi:S-adenosylmethionine hydrolase
MFMKGFGKIMLLLVVFFIVQKNDCRAQNGMLVIQTDFGVKDGAVSAMKGVIMQVDPLLKIFDLTHEIPAYNIWEGAYRLNQVAEYWPKGTVFVSVVDPGVGSDRKPIVAQTKNGYYFVTPDNGTLTFIAEHFGIAAVRMIDEKVNRLPGSSESYTFHGRDVFAYTAARLASHKISFTQVGPLLPAKIISIPYQPANWVNGVIKGNIPVLDVQYGNVWTNIPLSLLQKAGIHYGDEVIVTISNSNTVKYQDSVLFGKSFSDVAEQKVISYVNSLLNFSIAINMGNFALKHGIESGGDWSITIQKK